MHTLKIAGASYEGVSVVHFKDTSGNTCDYVDANDIAEQVIRGGITLTATLATSEGIDLATSEGEILLATKIF